MRQSSAHSNKIALTRPTRESQQPRSFAQMNGVGFEGLAFPTPFADFEKRFHFTIHPVKSSPTRQPVLNIVYPTLRKNPHTIKGKQTRIIILLMKSITYLLLI